MAKINVHDGYRYVICLSCGREVQLLSHPDDTRWRYSFHQTPHGKPCPTGGNLVSKVETDKCRKLTHPLRNDSILDKAKGIPSHVRKALEHYLFEHAPKNPEPDSSVPVPAVFFNMLVVYAMVGLEVTDPSVEEN